MARDDEMWSAIQRLEARDAIRDLHARYCFIQDRGHTSHAETEVQAFIELCHPDIVWDNSADQSRAHHGHAAVAAYLRRLWIRFDSCMHFVHNLLITFDSDTQAHGRSSFDAVGDIGGEAFVAAGYYEDQYIRTDSSWQFLLHREVPFFFVKVNEGWAGAKPKIMGSWKRDR